MQFRKVLPAFSVALILSASSLAHAWGMMRNLNGPHAKSHLVFAAYEHHKINYCLTITDGTAGGFTYKSMNVEVRMALQQWLKAVQKYTGPVAIRHDPDCSSSNLNLMVSVKPRPSDSNDPNPSYSWAEWQTATNRQYYHVFVISNYRYQHGGSILQAYDLAYIFRHSLSVTHTNLKDFLKMVALERESPSDLASLMPAKWEQFSNPIIENSSYADLLHEFGHSFGLCDSYNVSLNCDSNWTSNWNNQPTSVMAAGGFLYLTDDDIAGIQHLFSRYSYLKRK